VEDATAIIGLLVGFLVVGIIGVYVGDALITTAGLTTAVTTGVSTANYTHEATAPGAPYSWTVPAGVSSISFTLVGAGGGGGSGNSTDSKGGWNGTAGSRTTVSSLAVTPGTVLIIKHGKFGTGGDGTTNGDGTAGTNSSITIGTTLYNALGGIGGLTSNSTNATSARSGMPGMIGWGSTGSSAAGVANTSFAGGASAIGYGAGGGGGASANWLPKAGWSTGPWVDGSGGNGENGGTLITYDQTTGTTNALYNSQTSIIETFQLGVTLCKIIVIVSVASIIFVLLQQTGLIPVFGAGRRGPPPA